MVFAETLQFSKCIEFQSGGGVSVCERWLSYYGHRRLVRALQFSEHAKTNISMNKNNNMTRVYF